MAGSSEPAPPPEPIVVSRRVQAWRTAEFALLFGGLTALVDLAHMGRYLIAGLMLGAIVVTLVLRADPTFDRRRFFNFAGVRRELPFMLTTFAIGAAVMVGITLWLSSLPQFEGRVELFGFPRRSPEFYAIIMCAYPIFSVYPQELIYRTFFFHRYACLFRTPGMMIFASAASFGWAHAMFDNPRVAWDAELSVALTFVGGALMAWTYHRSRSTAGAWLEHSLFGDWVWTVGLGTLFYAGRQG